MKKFYLIVECHDAVKTNATTRFAVTANAVYVHDTKGFHKTHFKIYYKCRGKVRVKGIRVSNRGNLRIKDFIVENHTYIDYLLYSRSLTDEEIALCRRLEEKYLRGV